MTNTANLGMPFIDGSQAQKHVTHNEALRILDATVQIGVLATTLTTPPTSPAEGDRHVVAAGATGAWAGQAKNIATWEDGAWRFMAPKSGWFLWSAGDDGLFVYNGTSWRSLRDLTTALDNAAHVGVNTTASSPNLLTVRSNAALFNAIAVASGGTGDVRIQISKESSAKTASVVFSDAFSGRAEFGLTGDDDFHLKVSSDGATWFDAMKFDRATGRVSFPAGGAREVLTANRTYYIRTDGSDSNDGLANTSGRAFLTLQRAWNVIRDTLDLAGFTVTVQIADGTYTAGFSTGFAALGNNGGGGIAFVGNTTTPSNVLISTTGTCFVFRSGADVGLSGMKLASSGGDGVDISVNAVARLNAGVEFGAVAGAHILLQNNGVATVGANYTVSGNATCHWRLINGGKFLGQGKTVTLTGTPAFALAFASSETTSVLDAVGMTFSGAATGVRYSVALNGVLKTGGGGANFLPGNSAGSTATGGQYV